MSSCPGFELDEGALPDAPCRNIYYPSQADIVLGLVNKSEVSNNILDFSPLVEACATNKLIRHTIPHKSILQCP